MSGNKKSAYKIEWMVGITLSVYATPTTPNAQSLTFFLGQMDASENEFLLLENIDQLGQKDIGQQSFARCVFIAQCTFYTGYSKIMCTVWMGTVKEPPNFPFFKFMNKRDFNSEFDAQPRTQGNREAEDNDNPGIEVECLALTTYPGVVSYCTTKCFLWITVQPCNLLTKLRSAFHKTIISHMTS